MRWECESGVVNTTMANNIMVCDSDGDFTGSMVPFRTIISVPPIGEKGKGGMPHSDIRQ